MRKKEFLRQLEKELSHLDRDEREDILDYYDELIEDTIEKTGKSEGDVIYDLGEIEDIVRRVDPSHRRRMRYDEDEEVTSHRHRERNRKEERYVRVEDKDVSSRTTVGIVLLICLSPFWIALFAVLFGLIIAILSIGISCFAGGIVMVWHGCTLFSTALWAQGLFRVGIGIFLAGITLIVAPLLFKIVVGLGKIIICFFKWLFGERRVH